MRNGAERSQWGAAIAVLTFVAAVLVGAVFSSNQVVHADTCIYDVATVACVDVRTGAGADAGSAQLTGVRELAASLPAGIRGPSTTPVRSFIATNTGSISYGALDNLGRPTGVSAHVMPDMVGTGSPAARSITPPGFGGGSAGHARGHLLGNQLGGSGTDARNLVTMFQNPANGPVMRGFENQVRTALDAGQVVNYAATPIYLGSGLVPVGVTLRAQGSGGLNFFVSVLNRGL